MSGLVASTKMSTFLNQGPRPRPTHFQGDEDSLNEVDLHAETDAEYDNASDLESSQGTEVPDSIASLKGLAGSKKAGSKHSPDNSHSQLLSEGPVDSLELRGNAKSKADKKGKQPQHDSHSDTHSLTDREVAPSDEEEPVPVEVPPRKQFEEYEKMQKHLEWGRKLEPAGRAMDWMEVQMRWARQRASVMADKAVREMRKTAASQLKRLANALDEDSTPQHLSVELQDMPAGASSSRK